MTTMVETYIRINNEFIPIREFTGSLPDKDYVEGAIVCRIDRCDIFTIEHCDLIDQLWAYVVHGLSQLIHGEEYDTYFPDQPLRLRFEPVSAHCVKVTIGDKSQKVDSQLFVSLMRQGAIEFFDKMKILHPDADQTWAKYKEEAASLTI